MIPFPIWLRIKRQHQPRRPPPAPSQPPSERFRILDVRPAGWCESGACAERGARLTEDLVCPYCGWTPV